MRKLPPVTRKRDFFSKKYVITLPVWSPLVIGGFIALAILKSASTVANAVCLAMAAFSVIFCRIAWLHLKEMRYALHNALHDIDNDGLDLEDEPIHVVPGGKSA